MVYFYFANSITLLVGRGLVITISARFRFVLALEFYFQELFLDETQFSGTSHSF